MVLALASRIPSYLHQLVDMDESAILENYAALIDEIARPKPAVAKGRYLRTITLATSQGPGVRVDPTRTRNITEETAAVA